jgi:hypothetical protein
MAGIFISYRREDTGGHAGRIYDRLNRHFGRHRVFIDVDTIEPGVDFMEAIQEKVGSCDVLITVIGRGWLSCMDENGRRRLDDERDFVRIEVGTALARRVRVIPVLMAGAQMPRAEELPAELAPLSRRNALHISDANFELEVQKLIEATETAIATAANDQELPPSRRVRLAVIFGAVAAGIALLSVAGWLWLSVQHPAGPRSRHEVPATSTKRGPVSAGEGQPTVPKSRPFPSYALAKTLRDGERFFSSVRFSPNERFLAGVGEQSVRLWDTSNWSVLKLNSEVRVTSLSFSPDSRRLAAVPARAAGEGIVWDINTGAITQIPIGAARGFASAPGVAPPVLAASFDAGWNITVWDANWKAIWTDNKAAVRHLWFSPDGKTLALSGAEGDVNLLDARSGKVRNVLRNNAKLAALDFSLDGSLLATTSPNAGEIIVWEPGGGIQKTVLRSALPVGLLAFGPDGRILAALGEGGIQIWNVQTNSASQILTTQGRFNSSLAFSRHGRWLATCERPPNSPEGEAAIQVFERQ